MEALIKVDPIKNLWKMPVEYKSLVEGCGTYATRRLDYFPNADRFTFFAIDGTKGYTLMDHKNSFAKCVTFGVPEVSLGDADMYKEDKVIVAGGKTSKVVVVIHDVETDKKEVRDFYDFSAGPQVQVRVQQCESPKIVTGGNGLETYDFESGEPLSEWNKNKTILKLQRDPIQHDIFYAEAGAGEVMQYDIRVKEKPVGYYTAKFGTIKNILIGALGSKLIVTSSDKVTVFDPTTRKPEVTIEVPQKDTYFKNAVQYSNVLAVQWSHMCIGTLLIYDLNNLKGTAPKYDATKTIESPGAFQSHGGDPNYIMHWQMTSEGVFTCHSRLWNLPYA